MTQFCRFVLSRNVWKFDRHVDGDRIDYTVEYGKAHIGYRVASGEPEQPFLCGRLMSERDDDKQWTYVDPGGTFYVDKVIEDPTTCQACLRVYLKRRTA